MQAVIHILGSSATIDHAKFYISIIYIATFLFAKKVTKKHCRESILRSNKVPGAMSEERKIKE